MMVSRHLNLYLTSLLVCLLRYQVTTEQGHLRHSTPQHTEYPYIKSILSVRWRERTLRDTRQLRRVAINMEWSQSFTSPSSTETETRTKTKIPKTKQTNDQPEPPSRKGRKPPSQRHRLIKNGERRESVRAGASATFAAHPRLLFPPNRRFSQASRHTSYGC